jgi:hypothetical protein
MEINETYKAFLGVSWLYLITCSFTLAKTLRDRHEADPERSPARLAAGRHRLPARLPNPNEIPQAQLEELDHEQDPKLLQYVVAAIFSARAQRLLLMPRPRPSCLLSSRTV